MPAVAGGAVPTLSEIRDWDVRHLENAAEYWKSLGNQSTEAFSEAHRGSLHPGGTVWEGKAAEAAQDRSFADLVKVRGLAESLFSASDVARTGADDLAWAKRRVLDAVNEAEEAGFAVSEDLSVRYRGWMIGTDAEIAARQALAEEFAYEIQSRAAVLMAMDHEVAAKITAAVAPLGEVSFEETESSGSVHAVDYRRTPVHTDNPDGEEDPFVPGGHTHEPQPAQSGPIPFDPETGAAEEVNHPAFDAHLLPWEGACHAEQVRPGDPGQGGPSGARASGGLSQRVGGDHGGVQAVGDERRDAA